VSAHAKRRCLVLDCAAPARHRHSTLPLVKRSAERDRQVQVALVHATLSVAATLLSDWQTRASS
jgi:hypothetical protein